MADAQADSGPGGPGARPSTGILEARAAARAATVAELTKSSEAPTADASATPDVPAVGADGVAPEVTEPAPSEPAEPEKLPPPPVVEEKPDAETEKRLGAIQKAEKRSRELVAKEREEFKAEMAKMRADFERERQDMRPRAEAADKLEQLRARISDGTDIDVLAAMEALGVRPENYERTAKLLYGNRAGAKPEEREAAAKLAREREVDDRASKALARVEKLEKELAERDRNAQYERDWNDYYGGVVKAAQADTSESPLLRSALTKNPTKTQRAIQQLSAQLFEEHGEWPDAADVIATYEKHRRAELEELGIPVPINGTKASPAPAASAPARTLAVDMAGATPVPRTAKTQAEQRAETLRMMQSGKLE